MGSVETVRRLVWGVGRASPSTVERVAAALKMDVRVVSEWAKQRRESAEPYSPPKEAALLTNRHRAALDELIRAMAAVQIGATDAPATTPAASVTPLRRPAKTTTKTTPRAAKIPTATRERTLEYKRRQEAAAERDRQDVIQVSPEDH